MLRGAILFNRHRRLASSLAHSLTEANEHLDVVSCLGPCHHSLVGAVFESSLSLTDFDRVRQPERR